MHRRVKAQAGFAQHFDVAAVLEHHAFEDGAQQVPFAVPAANTVESGPETLRPVREP